MPLIAFDGMDGSGKSTHLDLATQTYQRLFPDEKPPIIIHHPAHTGLGRTVRDLLHVNKVRFNPHVEAYLYAADLVQQLLDVVDPAGCRTYCFCASLACDCACLSFCGWY